jgi:phosphonate transport system permease protein
MGLHEGCAVFDLALARCRRVDRILYATLPQVMPQLISYTLYRWENNIRAAATLDVVGAGGLGQQPAFYMILFQMSRTVTMLGAMVLLVALVAALGYAIRRVLAR